MNKNRGFTLVEIMIVVAIIGLLAAIAIPSFVKARNTSQQNACINNLRMVDAGKEQAAMAMRWSDGQATDAGTYRTTVNSYIKGGEHFCPGDNGTYTYNIMGENPACGFSGTSTSHKLQGS